MHCLLKRTNTTNEKSILIRGVRTRAVWIGVLAGRTLDCDQMNTNAEYQYMICSEKDAYAKC